MFTDFRDFALGVLCFTVALVLLRCVALALSDGHAWLALRHHEAHIRIRDQEIALADLEMRKREAEIQERELAIQEDDLDDSSFE